MLLSGIQSKICIAIYSLLLLLKKGEQIKTLGSKLQPNLAVSLLEKNALLKSVASFTRLRTLE